MTMFLWWLTLVARIGQQLAGAGDEEEFFPDDPLLVHSSDVRCN